MFGPTVPPLTEDEKAVARGGCQLMSGKAGALDRIFR